MNNTQNRIPLYTVKQVCQKTGLTPHAIRFYDKEGLLPVLARSEGNVRLFSEYDLGWLQVVQCFRATGMSVADVKRYIDLCGEGDDTVDERYKIILEQEKKLKEQIRELNQQMKVLQSKKYYYTEIIEHRQNDRYNPATAQIPEAGCLKTGFPDGNSG